MDIITEEVVEETWQETGGFSPKRAKKEMSKVGKRQPNLLAFVAEFIQDLNMEVQGLAFYMLFVICRMFEKCAPQKIKKITKEEIIDCHEQNEAFIESLKDTHNRFFERIARVQLSSQPYVMKYVTETLIEAPEEQDPVPLTEDDTGYLFLIFKTVVDVLNEKTESAANG
jgi:hypothetical protein